MSNLQKLALALALVLGVAGLFTPVVRQGFGGAVHNILETFDEGIAVDGTTVVDGSGNWVGAVAAALNSTFTNIDASGEIEGSVIDEGGVLTLSATSTAQTLTAAQMCNNNVVEWDNLGTSSTLTLAASTTLIADCLDDDGDQISLLFDSLTATTSVITITAGSGNDLIAENTGDDLIDEGKQARINLVRSGSVIFVELRELQAAD